MTKITWIITGIILGITQLNAQFLPIEHFGDELKGNNEEVISADLNNDGLNEIISFDNSSWYVWENLGYGNNYSPSSSFTYEAGNLNIYTAYQHVSGQAVDIDGDGLLDLVHAFIILHDSDTGSLGRSLSSIRQGPPPLPPLLPYYAQGVVLVYRNLGNLEFAPPKFLIRNAGAINQMLIVNLDDNPQPEIVVNTASNDSVDLSILSAPYWTFITGQFNNYEPQTIILYNHSLQDTIPSSIAVLREETRGIHNLAAGDINADGAIDLILATTDTAHAEIYYNQGSLTFLVGDTIALPSDRLMDLQLIDLNQDNRLDLAYATRSATNKINVFYCLYGNETFDLLHSFIDSVGLNNFSRLRFWDVNNDGYPEFIYSNLNEPDVMYLQNFDGGTFAQESNYYCKNLGRFFIEHHGDNNGVRDLIFYTPNATNNDSYFRAIYSLLNAESKNEPAEWDIVNPQEFANPITLLAQDINNDGIKELLVGCQSEPAFNSVDLTIEDDYLKKQFLYSNLSGVRSFSIADFDMDGDMDFALVTGSNNLVIVNQEFPGQYSDTLIPNDENIFFTAVHAVDFNLDGKVDILQTADFYTQKPLARLHLNNGDGSFLSGEMLTEPVNYGPGSIRVEDWNEDGYPDLLLTQQNRIIYFQNQQGQGLAAPDTILANCSVCYGFTFADFNMDGLKDLFFKSGIRNIVLYNLNNSIQYITDTIAIIQPSANIFTLEDINYDGIPDIIMAYNNNVGQIRAYVTGFTDPNNLEILATYDGSITQLLSADLNQDGFFDLYGINATQNKVFWLYADYGIPLMTYSASSKNKISIYPNPGNDVFHVKSSSKKSIHKLEIVGTDGILKEQPVISAGTEVQFTCKAAPGIYILRAYTSEGIEYLKFVKSGH